MAHCQSHSGQNRVGQGVMSTVLHFAETQYVALTFPTWAMLCTHVCRILSGMLLHSALEMITSQQ